MKKVKVDFYDAFHCIADQCPMTCCGQWRIAVDAETAEKWRDMHFPQGSTDGKTLLSRQIVPEQDSEEGHICLKENKMCPFLNKQKLCNLVLTYGEDSLSHTCHIFPRIENAFADQTEYALMAGCPAVLDLMNQGRLISFTEQESEERQEIQENDICVTTRELRTLRRCFIELLQNPEYSIEEALLAGFFVLLEYREEKQKFPGISFSREKQNLEKCVKAIRRMQFSAADTFQEDNELWLDLAVNYREEGYYTDLLAPLQERAEQMEGIAAAGYLPQWEKFLKEVLPQYDMLLRNILASELFAGLFRMESSLEDALIAFEWLTMEYSFMRFGMFLSQTCRYEAVREIIAVTMRMTGYDDEDIVEYLDQSFDSRIWEWGYMAMLLGKTS